MSPVRKAVIAQCGNHWRQYPASSAMPVALFPLVDRDGLTKPMLQIVAEEAIDSGIESIAVIASTDEERLLRDYFRRWPEETARSLKGHDWAALQSERLRSLGERITFLNPARRGAEQSDAGLDLLAAQSFVGSDPFLLLPASTVFVSGTKDRCANQLLGCRLADDAESLTLITPVMQRETHFTTLVQTSVERSEAAASESRVFSMTAIVHHPTTEQCRSLSSPQLPFGQFFVETGMGIHGAQFFEALNVCASSPCGKESLLTRVQKRLMEEFHRSYCVPLIGAVYDAALPYGLLEAQLGLALAGIHRTDICEMIARTLAQQAKS